MKHTHVIEAANASEFKKHVKELYQELYGLAAVPHGLMDKTPPAATAAEVEQEKPAAKKRGPKPKEEKETPTVSPSTPVEPAAPDTSADDIFGDDAPAPAAPVAYTMEDCQKRLQALVASKGIVKAKELLSKFGIAKLVELPKEKYTAFIESCDALVA